MASCQSCGIDVPGGSRFCPACGAGLSQLREAATRPDSQAREPTPGPDRREDPCRVEFSAGDVLAERYRVRAKLGSGGMGSVYRAEDLRLGQDVALKFVADSCVHTEQSASSLLNEVRLARRVTHPNVCRVHDLGEINGLPFISMEYVDGEDLDTLLRRIGHLPPAKATQIARQLCSGLQAAHEQGVLHQDLKPANVMIDGRGNARITDFGIAGARKDSGNSATTSGTPAYMAPELFTGAGSSEQSDLYSLGLLLYELFTGQRLFNASSMTELLRQHRLPVVPPSRLVQGMEAGVEQAILSCLERDPARRPRSAVAVLAALPGGDPLADALAAGQTPSPELVAASGGSGQLPWRTTGTLVAAILLGLVLVLWLEPRVKLITRTPLPRSAAVLADRAREHIAELGFPTGDRHAVYGFDVHSEYVAEIARRPDASYDLWNERLGYQRPTVIDFWYRQAPARLMANNIKGRVTWEDPPAVLPGTVQVRLDPSGRLRELVAIPEGEPTDGDEFDWAALLAAAGLDIAELSPQPAARIPPAFADRRAAWSGVYPEPPHLPIRVEAAAFAGAPVALHISEKRWPEQDAGQLDRGATTQLTWRFPARVGLILCALGLSFYSLRRRRGDPRGSFRFAMTVFLLVVAFTVLTGDHGSWGAVGALLLKGMSHGLAVAFEFALYYFALEPHVRRIWPQSLIPWTRLLSGQIRDPLVGHTLLVGVVLGVVSSLFSMAELLVHRWAGEPEHAPLMLHPSAIETLMGPSSAIGALLELVVDSARESMKVFMSLVLLKMVLKRPTLVALASGLIWATVWNQGAVATLSWLGTFGFAIAFTLVAIHFGLLAIIVGFITFSLLMSFPLPTDLSVWYGQSTVITLATVLGATAFGGATVTKPAR